MIEESQANQASEAIESEEFDDVALLMSDLPPMLSTKETMLVLGLKRETVDKLRRNGEIKAIQHEAGRRGSPIRYMRSSIESYIRRTTLAQAR